VIALSAFLFLGYADTFLLESKVETRSGLFERFVSPQDERAFKVRRTDPENKVTWVEDFEGAPGETRRVTPEFLGSSDKSLEMVLIRDEGRWQLWDTSVRIFEKDNCAALTRVEFPTPLNKPELFVLSDLVCRDPLTTESKEILVLGRNEENHVSCEGDLCWWKARYKENPESAVQASVMSFLWRTDGELLLSGINAFLPKISALSWFGSSNRSLYDANQRKLFFGAGQYLDGLDGFIVAHEWTHFLIDQLNPGLVGFWGQVIHEAFADFFAANLFGSSCVAPFDAQEVKDRKCVRNLENSFKVPQDLSGRDRYQSSLILSGALWEVRKFFPQPLMNELLVETVIRLPKKPELAEVWGLMSKIQKSMIEERVLLEDTSEDFLEVGRRRGLIKQFIEE